MGLIKIQVKVKHVKGLTFKVNCRCEHEVSQEIQKELSETPIDPIVH